MRWPRNAETAGCSAIYWPYLGMSWLESETTGHLESIYLPCKLLVHILVGTEMSACLSSPSENFRKGGVVLPTSSHKGTLS